MPYQEAWVSVHVANEKKRKENGQKKYGMPNIQDKHLILRTRNGSKWKKMNVLK